MPQDRGSVHSAGESEQVGEGTKPWGPGWGPVVCAGRGAQPGPICPRQGRSAWALGSSSFLGIGNYDCRTSPDKLSPGTKGSLVTEMGLWAGRLTEQWDFLQTDSHAPQEWPAACGVRPGSSQWLGASKDLTVIYACFVPDAEGN